MFIKFNGFSIYTWKNRAKSELSTFSGMVIHI